MLQAHVFRMFWAVFIVVMAWLGVTIAVVAGATLACGDLTGGATAALLTAACGLLCGAGQESLRALPSP